MGSPYRAAIDNLLSYKSTKFKTRKKRSLLIFISAEQTASLRRLLGNVKRPGAIYCSVGNFFPLFFMPIYTDKG